MSPRRAVSVVVALAALVALTAAAAAAPLTLDVYVDDASSPVALTVPPGASITQSVLSFLQQVRAWQPCVCVCTRGAAAWDCAAWHTGPLLRLARGAVQPPRVRR